ncbi:MAG: LPS-assembly protein LptD [Alphaproteobacteria bacterium]|nr:LPS-assembly protein LptD [Alphaproteobacteria bacterium]
MPLSKKNQVRKILLGSLLCGASLVCAGVSHAGVTDVSDKPIDLSSNILTYDEQNQIITAQGEVEFTQGDRIVRASEISYDLKQDIIKASGEVVIVEANGDVHFSTELELEKNMSNGLVQELTSILADGSRFTAEQGERINGTKVKMRKATYTPCKVCEVSGDGEPAWQIKAREVVHDKESKTIEYSDATFEMFGVPIAYTPYFSHADGSVEKKSGFLPPSFSAGSNLGFGVTSQYYWDIAPGVDATLGARVYSSENPLFLGEVRKRYDNASVKFDTGFTYSERNGIANAEAETRGHLFGEGLWNIDDKWRAGFDVAHASDDQYMRQYDITTEDVLENELYIERFSGRNYGAARALYYQDIRVDDDIDVEQPSIFPEIEANFMGDPNKLLGGRWDASISSLGLVRDGNGADSYRITTDMGWQKRHVTDFGLVNTLDLSVRGDLYASNDVTGAAETDDRDARAFPTAHFIMQYPLSKPVRPTTIAIIEPIVSLTARTNINENTVIPNEDSRDVQIDASNLFEEDRFPGYDRVEDQSRVTYGLRTGLYEDDGSKIEVFIGQSYRFSDDDDLFPNGSGLEEQSSDVVGEISLDYRKYYSLDYRFQFGSDDFHSKRHELDATASVWRFKMNTTYLYAEALEGTTITENREQLNVNVRTRLTDEWFFRSGALYDLGEDDGLRKSILGLEYEGQCLSISALMQRNLTREEAGENSTAYFVTIGLKNLGQFEGKQ